MRPQHCEPELNALIDDPAGALIALDFDGTLSAIVLDPNESTPVPGAIDALVRLSERGAQVAVVTGRDALTALRLGGLDRIPGVVVSGLHGAETWRAGQLSTRPEPGGIAQLRATLPALLADVDSDAWLEDKRLSLVVHTRRSAEPQATLDRLTGPVTQLAAEHGLDVVGGKFVLEIRIPGLSKADAVQALLSGDPSAALFAGDDHGDLPAFEAVSRWAKHTGKRGITIAVGDVEQVRQAAMLQIDSPEQLVPVLWAVAGEPQHRP
ncbi:MAG: trehalose 6-phosphate phosphatase [Pseudonocardiales bacterium]|jgi:trehalose 6-phosphate phosphatase|nr:trehalose 6-phosphate phosphatase [Pseudonocardiales bacterium]